MMVRIGYPECCQDSAEHVGMNELRNGKSPNEEMCSPQQSSARTLYVSRKVDRQGKGSYRPAIHSGPSKISLIEEGCAHGGRACSLFRVPTFYCPASSSSMHAPPNICTLRLHQHPLHSRSRQPIVLHDLQKRPGPFKRSINDHVFALA